MELEILIAVLIEFDIDPSDVHPESDFVKDFNLSSEDIHEVIDLTGTIMDINIPVDEWDQTVHTVAEAVDLIKRVSEQWNPGISQEGD